MVNVPKLIQMEQLHKVKIARLEKRIQELEAENKELREWMDPDHLESYNYHHQEILDAEIVEEPND